MLTLGWLLILFSPIVGALPGPGFIIMFPVGLALVLKNSLWAKRRYVSLKRRFPDHGRWTDWALRRRRARKMPRLPGIKDTFRRIFRPDVARETVGKSAPAD